jgi:3-(3-hydroxy-phenyl)propionate hydroxylase
MANIQQNILERLMIECAGRQDLIDLRWQSEVTDVTQDERGVTLTVSTPQGTYDIRGHYAVAADGARSAMRRHMGLKMQGEAHSATYLIADIKLETQSPTERRAWFDSPINRGSTILMHRQPHDIWRLDYQLHGDDDIEETDRERLGQRIQDVLDMAGETGSWELDWVSRYRAYSLCLDHYVHGRVCFAGDAAHLVPIFGVKGLNSGLADANNLGWKLAAVLKGEAGPNLLPSYDQERRAATLDIFAAAGKSTRFMTPPTRGHQLVRKGVLSLAVTQAWAGKLADPRQSVPFRYDDSALNAFVAEDGDFASGPPVGASLPSCRLADGYLHDLLDFRPTLLYFTGPGDVGLPCDALARATDGRALNLIVVGAAASHPDDAVSALDEGGAVAQKLDAGHGTYYLLRPDWHVAARIKSDPELSRLRDAINGMYGHAN